MRHILCSLPSTLPLLSVLPVLCSGFVAPPATTCTCTLTPSTTGTSTCSSNPKVCFSSLSSLCHCRQPQRQRQQVSSYMYSNSRLYASDNNNNDDSNHKKTLDTSDDIRKIGLASAEARPSTIEEIADQSSSSSHEPQEIPADPTKAATNTVNARLQAELSAAAEAEKAGGKSRLARKVKEAFKSERTDAERQRSIDEARDLNGVNPCIAGGSGLVAFAGSYALWTATSFIAELFASNPVETDFYTAARLSGVFRTVIIGLFSLASGFFGVIGLGLVLLGGRVAVGVLTGELDPTPIKKRGQEAVVLPDVWDLMLNKKPGRRGGRTKGRSDGNDDNPFGI